MGFELAIKALLNSPHQLSDLIGADPVDVSPLAGGTVSYVYKASLGDGRTFILKMADDADLLRAERIFLDAWATIGLRTPQIYRHGVVEVDVAEVGMAESSATETVPIAYLIMAMVSGHNLFPLMEANSQSLRGEATDNVLSVTSPMPSNAEILQDLGVLLAQMHTITVTGYGFIQFDSDTQVSGKSPTLVSTLSDPDWVACLKENQRYGNLRPDELPLVSQAATMLDNQRQGQGSCLAHSDFRAGNILYNPTHPQPYAVIDPSPELTHPYFCLAYSLLLEEIHGRNDPRHFRSGYETVTAIDSRALRAALFLRALMLLPRWGKPHTIYAKPLRALFEREKQWIMRHISGV